LNTSWPKTDQQLLNDTLDAFYQQNEADNLLNLSELNQLVPESVERLRNTASQSRVQRALSNLSKGFLVYSFGIAPLVADIRKTMVALSNFRKDFQRASKSAGRRVSVHRQLTGTVSLNAGTLKPQYPAAPWADVHTAGFHALKVCTVSGINSTQYRTSAFRQLDYLVSKLGTTGPASFLWEKIPWSFVVDWFVDLRGACNAFDNLFTGFRKRADNACISVKYNAVISSKMMDPRSVVPAVNQVISTSSVDYYHRMPVVPSSKVVTSGRFGKKQLALTAALLYQSIAKR
jgi:hypothetical protein